MASTKSTLLSPLDQIMTRAYVRIFLTFAVDDHATAIQRLQDALDKTCAQIPYLRGHVSERPHERNQLALSWSDDDPTPQIQEKPKPEGMPSYAHLKQERAPLHYFQNVMCPVDAMPDNAKGAAAIAASYVRLEGGLVVCLALHHNVTDGTGMGEIVRRWAAHAKGDDSSAAGSAPDPDEPLTRRARVLTAQSSDPAELETLSQSDLLARHPAYTLLSKLLASAPSTAASSPGPPAGTSKLFTFSVAKLAALKDALRSSIKHEFLTTNNILSAIVWSTISHIRASRATAPITAPSSKLGYAVNARGRVGPALLEPPYLGNVNLYALADVSFADLRAAAGLTAEEEPRSSSIDALAKVVAAIGAATARVDAAHVAGVAALAERSPDLADVIPGWSFMNGPDLAMSSWASLGVYECDFGEAVGGCPEFVRVPFASVDGLVIVLPRRRGRTSDGAEKEGEASGEEIEVVVLLREDDLKVLEGDGAWMSWSVEA